MTKLTKRWLKVIVTGAFALATIGPVAATPMRNDLFDCQSWEIGATSFSAGDSCASDLVFLFSSMEGLWESSDLELLSAAMLTEHVLLTENWEQSYVFNRIRNEMTDCDLSPEECHGAGVAASNGAESVTGISKPTAILLLIVGFIGLMRARGKPIQ
jgi:hypothetical protein